VALPAAAVQSRLNEAATSKFACAERLYARLHFARLGAIAQLGERLDRTQEVAGSSPASSTKKRPAQRAFLFSGLATKSAENAPWSSFGQVAAKGLIVPKEVAGSSPASSKAELKAPTYDCSSIAYSKMVDKRGSLCFPDAHQLGLDVLVKVERNTAGFQDPPALEGQIDTSS
jgi:hypothetical protein